MGAASRSHVHHVFTLLRLGSAGRVQHPPPQLLPTVPDMEPPPGYFTPGDEISTEEEEGDEGDEE